MMRAVNQAAGRVIRHKDDYGVVFLLDHKYFSKISALSQWLRKYMSPPAACTHEKLVQFFDRNAKERPAPPSPP